MERENIKQALLKAYEAGWRGSLELKEEYVEEALNDLPEEKKHEEEKKYTVNTAGMEALHSWTIQSDASGVSPEWVANRNNWTETIPDAETITLPEVTLPDVTISLPEDNALRDTDGSMRFEDDI